MKCLIRNKIRWEDRWIEIYCTSYQAIKIINVNTWIICMCLRKKKILCSLMNWKGKVSYDVQQMRLSKKYDEDEMNRKNKE